MVAVFPVVSRRLEKRSMLWNDYTSHLELIPPEEFKFNECLVFMGRSNNECLHFVQGDCLYKLIKVVEEPVLLKITSNAFSTLNIEFPVHPPSKETRAKVANYVWELFDLGRDLKIFYKLAHKDTVLTRLVTNYYGLRIIGIPDLFEALVWAILGQQINLAFAYTLKRHFVEQFGQKYTTEGITYWLFPEPETIAHLEVSDLTKLQFTTRKAEYVIGVAKSMVCGDLTKEDLLRKGSYEETLKSLLSIRGVGKWTAEYVMMKCLKFTSAFPLADVGLHNSLKIQLGLNDKPTIAEIEKLALNWKDWEAYATFYLWRSLYE